VGANVLRFLKTLAIVFGIGGAAACLAWLGFGDAAKKVEGYTPDRVSITEVIGG
jgi:hypothetical protein